MPSLRAEQRRLGGQMRAAGIDVADIAAVFAFRYGLRPRVAWRQAHGWSLVKAAECINQEAFAAGLHPGGNTMVMTAAHLCEHETWPGPGDMVTGRKPTAYVLALLARAYGAGITQLLDVDDYRSLPAADRLIFEACISNWDACAGSPAGNLAFRPRTAPVRPSSGTVRLHPGQLTEERRPKAIRTT
jgi:hypothetical protein